jgi:hypothetical protein
VSIAQWLAGGLFVACLVLFLRQLPHAIRVWLTYTGTGHRRQEDVTDRAPDPEPDAVERIAILATLDYRPIGDTRVRLPSDDRFAKILVAGNLESYAIVDSTNPSTGLTGLYTAWPDGTWIGTLHPYGDPHERPGLQLRVHTGKLGDAVSAHRSWADQLRPDHGDPRPIERMPDVLALDADYRQRFGGRELRRAVIRALTPTAIVLLATVASLYLFATTR